MPIASPKPLHDPLQIFLERRRAPHPVPLISTDFSVTIDGGLAIVSTARVFRNAETGPIEATLTFPMPVHATLFDLTVKIGDRVLHAKAQGRHRARATYEDAIDRGKSAVLHEEVLRGIHMLSLAHIPAGETVEVKTEWVTTLTVIAAKGHLRIPLTVGDVYGHSPLPESDDLKTGGAPFSGTLEVRAPDARVTLAGGTLAEGKTRLMLNRPIDLIVDGWRSGAVTGRGADGRTISLGLEAAPDRASPLNIAILVDHSGSMQERASGGAHGGTLTKHDHVMVALRLLADRLSGEDKIDLWEFDDHARRIGTGKLGLLVNQLSPPAGGTEIGIALTRAIRESTADGVLLITDGKSHALDVQGLARMGRKISVVLMGEDSLEANVGYLAALTGGDIFVSGGADMGDLLNAALGSLRHGRGSLEAAFQRSGMRVTVVRDASSSAPSLHERAVAAAAASFLLPALPEAEATDLAEREGIVSHLTSLVLVDEHGATQDTLPAQRPVALPSPAAPVQYCASAPPRMRAPSAQFRRRSASPPAGRRGSSLSNVGRELFAGLKEAVTSLTTKDQPKPVHHAPGIDWASDPGRLMAGDLSGLSEATRDTVLAMTEMDEIKNAATSFGMPPVLLVIALLAFAAGRDGERTARRIARRLLGQNDETRILALVRLLEG